MKRLTVGIIITIVSVLAIVSVVVVGNRDNTSQTSDTRVGSENTHEEIDRNRGEHEDSTSTNANEVVIKDFAFGPKSITVKKGTTVTWTNRDSAKHDITPEKEDGDFVASKLLAKGESYNFTFDQLGTYPYYCSPHPYMKAAVEVIE